MQHAHVIQRARHPFEPPLHLLERAHRARGANECEPFGVARRRLRIAELPTPLARLGCQHVGALPHEGREGGPHVIARPAGGEGVEHDEHHARTDERD